MARQINWIPEKEAAALLGYTDHLWFRRLVRYGTYNISYRCTPTRRFYEYDERQVRNVKNNNAFIIHDSL